MPQEPHSDTEWLQDQQLMEEKNVQNLFIPVASMLDHADQSLTRHGSGTEKIIILPMKGRQLL
jgi:hypothetical protein